MDKLKEIYNYREMICKLIQRDLRGRYKGSVLGFAWTFLNPLLQLVVYTLVFSVVMRAGIPDYYLFLFVALIPWIFFSASLTGGASCIINQKDMIKKIYFPREVLPIAHVTSQLINMLFSFVVIFGVLFISGKGINILACCFLPVVIIAEYLLSVSIALISSAITVYFRDLEHVLSIVALAWQFVTPVMYPMDMVPDELGYLLKINPMVSIITCYRDILYYKNIPEIHVLAYAFLLSIILLILGRIIFEKCERRFAEEL